MRLAFHSQLFVGDAAGGSPTPQVHHDYPFSLFIHLSEEGRRNLPCITQGHVHPAEMLH